MEWDNTTTCLANKGLINDVFLFVSFPFFLSVSAYFFFPEPLYLPPLKSSWTRPTQMLSIPGFVLGRLLNRKVGESEGEGGESAFLEKTHPDNTCAFFAFKSPGCFCSHSFSRQRILLEGCSSEASKCPPLQAAMSDLWGGGGGSDFWDQNSICGWFYLGGWMVVGVGHGFAAFQEEGGLCPPLMSHGKEMSDVCKQLGPSFCFLLLHPAPI